MFSIKKGSEGNWDQKKENFVRNAYKKIVTDIEKDGKANLSPEAVEEKKAEALKNIRELVNLYNQELQTMSRLTDRLKRRNWPELEKMIGELQLGKVTAQEFLNLIIKLENNIIPEEQVKAQLMEWVNRAEKHTEMQQIEKMKHRIVEAVLQPEQKMVEMVAAWQVEIKAGRTIEQMRYGIELSFSAPRRLKVEEKGEKTTQVMQSLMKFL